MRDDTEHQREMLVDQQAMTPEEFAAKYCPDGPYNELADQVNARVREVLADAMIDYECPLVTQAQISAVVAGAITGVGYFAATFDQLGTINFDPLKSIVAEQFEEGRVALRNTTN